MGEDRRPNVAGQPIEGAGPTLPGHSGAGEGSENRALNERELRLEAKALGGRGEDAEETPAGEPSDPPLQQHGDALLDGSGTRHGLHNADHQP